MKRIVSEPTWGAMVVEDTETSEFSFQCLCGGAAMYWTRVVLNEAETKGLLDGSLNPDQMVSDVCKQKPYLEDRIRQSFDVNTLVGGKPAPKP